MQKNAKHEARQMDQMISRRTFLKSALVVGALVSLDGVLAACSSEGASSGENMSASSAAVSAVSEVSSVASSGASSSAGVSGSILVAYYSAQGHTEAVAQAAADELGADVFVIAPVNPYAAEDLNYNSNDSRVSAEHNDPDGRHVELVEVAPANFDAYDTILVGYPIWWGEASWVVDDFVQGNDFAGKTVIPFCTSASSPLGDSGQLLADMAGAGNWQEGRRFSSSVSESDVREWAASLLG